MTKTKTALLLSAAAAILLGTVLWKTGTVPELALSYGIGGNGGSAAAHLLAMSVPCLPPLPQASEEEAEGEGATAPEGEVVLSQPVFSPTDFAPVLPSKPAKADKVLKKTYASSFSVNNLSPKTIQLKALAEKVPAIVLSESGPQILIVHTHTTEAYNDGELDWYGAEELRSEDSSKNMVRMGEILEKALTDRGYSVLHCQKIHDTDFNASYTESNKTVREYLEKYPSISIVIDLHRDTLIDDQGTKYRPVVTLDGEETAQIMLLMGVGNDTYPHPNWQENLSLAARIQKEATESYPGLMRPILVRPSRYNQHLCNGAILVELGACGNTPREAENAAKRFGEVCAAALDQLRKEQA